MFDLPIDPQITLEDTQAFHQALLSSGAPINEINTLRKHFSAVKGGRLAMAAPDAAKVSLLLPDVPLRSLDALSSGPSSPDHSTVAEVRELIARYNLAAKFPPSVRAFFERTDMPESPGNKSWLPPFFPKLAKPEAVLARRVTSAASMSDEDPAFRDSVFEILLSSHDLVENARALAEKAGYHTVVDNSCDDWDYADAARYLLGRFHALRAIHPRLCLISVGEVTVTMDRTPGAGGRNQQFAMFCALELEKYPRRAPHRAQRRLRRHRRQHPVRWRHRRSHHRRPRPHLRLPPQGVARRLQRLPHVHRPRRLRRHRPHRPKPPRPPPPHRRKRLVH